MKSRVAMAAGVCFLMAQGAGAQPVKTAGEAMKNVRVLKEVPVADWNDTMAYMGSALGVGCGHCHQGQEFEKDDLKAKQTARQMILMVRELNAKAFGGKQMVSCNTCHRGNVQPKESLVLPSKSAGETAAVKTDSLPDADAVLARYRKAVGGDAVQSLVMKATVTVGERPPLEMELNVVFPDKFWQRVTVGGQEMVATVNGDRGWAVAPGRSFELTPANLATARLQIDKLRPARQFAAEATRKTVGVEKIGERTYTVVEANSDRRRERLYFDTETGLLFKEQVEVRSPLGTIPQESTYSDYRDVKGVKLAHLINATNMSTQTRTQYREIQINVAPDAKRFEGPPAGAAK